MNEELEKLVRGAQEGAARVGKGLGPGGDWTPVLLLESYVGGTTVVGIDPALFSSEETKDALADEMWSAVFSSHAVRGAYLSSVWMSMATDDHPAQHPASEDPERVEALFIVAADFDETVACSAMIHRDAQGRPTLAPWESSGEGLELSGRFVEPLRAAIGMERQLAEDPAGLLASLADREDLSPESRAGARALAEMARRDPEGFDHMPIRQWWLAEQERRRANA